MYKRLDLGIYIGNGIYVLDDMGMLVKVDPEYVMPLIQVYLDDSLYVMTIYGQINTNPYYYH